MKTVYLMLACATLSGAIEMKWTEANRAWEANQAELWEQNLAKAQSMTNDQKFDFLALGLRNMGHRTTIPEHSPAIDSIYRKLQQEFLAIPGHATYFRDQIKAAEQDMKAGKIGLGAWDDLRMNAFHTLRELPSEETVAVLGELLFDYFLMPASSNPDDTNVPNYSFDLFLDSYAVSPAAAAALDRLGIENPPVKPNVWDPGSTKKWQTWWKEVKEGRRKYRFKGSTTEHPVDSPLQVIRKERERQRASGGTAVQYLPGGNASTPEGSSLAALPPSAFGPIVAGILAVLAALAYAVLKRSKPA